MRASLNDLAAVHYQDRIGGLADQVIAHLFPRSDIIEDQVETHRCGIAD